MIRRVSAPSRARAAGRGIPLWPLPGGADRGGLRGARPACIEQVVTGKEASGVAAAGSRVRRARARASAGAGLGAYGMYLPPTPEVWFRVPSWRFLAAGVEQRRSRTLCVHGRPGRRFGADVDRLVRASGSGAAQLPRRWAVDVS